MTKTLTLDVTSFKFADNETDLSFRAMQNGVIISDSTLSATIKIKQVDAGYLKSVSAKWVDKRIVISSGDLSDLPVGSYSLELWLSSPSGYEIYPDSGFVNLYINQNATGISGNLISSITLAEFQQQFSDLAKEVNNKIELKANSSDMTSLQNAMNSLQNKVEAFGITPENLVTIKSLLDAIASNASDSEVAELINSVNILTNNISLMSDGDYSPKANKTDLESLQSAVNNQSETISETTAQLAEIGSQVDLLNRGLGETFATLVDLQTAYPTGDTKDHIVAVDGHRYFWDETIVAWKDGGAYQAVELTDNVATANNMNTDYYRDIFTKVNDYAGYINSTNGVFLPQVDKNRLSDYIPVKQGVIYKFPAFNFVNELWGCIFNSSKVYISTNYTDTSRFTIVGDYVLYVPAANDAFVRFTYAKRFSATNYDYNSFYLLQQEFGYKTLNWLKVNYANLDDDVKVLLGQRTNVYAGKTSAWIGDSITYGYGLSDLTKCFSQQVSTALSMTGYLNLGVSGSSIAKNDGNAAESFVKRIVTDGDLSSSKDYCFIAGGVNDYQTKNNLADITTALAYFKDNGVWDDYEVCGALSHIITHLKTTYPTMKLFGITPFHTSRESETYKTSKGITLDLRTYVQKIREVYEYHGVTVIDMYADMPIDPKNTYDLKNYTYQKTDLTYDGIHPNLAWHDLITKYLKMYLKNRSEFIL